MALRESLPSLHNPSLNEQKLTCFTGFQMLSVVLEGVYSTVIHNKSLVVIKKTFVVDLSYKDFLK